MQIVELLLRANDGESKMANLEALLQKRKRNFNLSQVCQNTTVGFETKHEETSVHKGEIEVQNTTDHLLA